MALDKTIINDKIEIYDRGAYKSIGVRTATIIKDDGVEVSRTFHRAVLNPNDDISAQTDEIKALAAIYFTDEAKEAQSKVNDVPGP